MVCVSPSPRRSRPSSSRAGPAAPPRPDAPDPPLARSLNHVRTRIGPRISDSPLRSASLVRLEPRPVSRDGISGETSAPVAVATGAWGLGAALFF
ncbi:hypothetical protein NN561_007667 [Cricetulus griseus]